MTIDIIHHHSNALPSGFKINFTVGRISKAHSSQIATVKGGHAPTDDAVPSGDESTATNPHSLPETPSQATKPHGVPPPTPCGTPNPAGEP